VVKKRFSELQKIDERDIFGRLIENDNDLLGAISVKGYLMTKMDKCLITLKPLKSKKERLTGYTREGIISLVGNSDITLLLPFTRNEFITVQPIRQKGMSISGYQPKLSLSIINNELNVVENSATYILKPSPEEYPHLAEKEHAMMLIMKKLGFDLPPFGLVSFSKEKDKNSEYAFIIKRYDREMIDGQATKMHQEQLDGAMGVADKYGKVNNVAVISYEQACLFLINKIDLTIPSPKISDIF